MEPERQPSGADRDTVPGFALAFILAAVALDMIALGITVPVLPGLIKQLVHEQVDVAARYLGWIAAAWAGVNFIASPILGRLSDRYGRRPIMIASMLGTAVDYIVMALAPSVAILFLARIVSAATSASVITANACIADVTPPERRAARFGLVQASIGIGLIGGPILGGVLGDVDLRLPFYFAGGLCLLNGLFGFFALPESLAPGRRDRTRPLLASPLSSMRIYAASPALTVLAGVMLLFHVARQAGITATVPFVAYKFGWSPGIIGVAAVVLGISGILVQALLVQRFVSRFGEFRSALIGLAAGTVGYLIYGFAPTGFIFMSGVLAYAFNGLVGPMAQAAITREVDPDRQGQLQGANASLIAIASVIGAPLFTEAFARAIGPWSSWAPSGLPYYLAAGLQFVAFLAMLRLTALSRKRALRPS